MMNKQPVLNHWGEDGQKRYPHTASACRFLLGGIGTGNVSLDASGKLRDFEWFNKPNKGGFLPYTFFALWAKSEQGEKYIRVLEAEYPEPHELSHGYLPGDTAGLPRMRASEMTAHYPFVQIDYDDEDAPLSVSLEAFTPLVPLDADASSYPGAVFRYHVRNDSLQTQQVSIAGSLANAAGLTGYDNFENLIFKTPGKNTWREEQGLKGVFMCGDGLPEDDLTYGTLALVTPNAQVSKKTAWLVGEWLDHVHDFWDDFCEDGRLQEVGDVKATTSRLGGSSRLRIGSVAAHEEILPGEEKVFTFYMMWHFPNRPRAWQGHICPGDTHVNEVIKTRVHTLFADAWDAAEKLHANLNGLEDASRKFAHALFESTLPAYVLEAMADNITVIRSPTCFRLADGTFLAWEGGFYKAGCCEGNCTHVWNYTQTMAFLFPELERSMRRTEFLVETGEDGNMAFRTMQVFGDPKWDMIPATDGQMGTIVRLYREWKFSGDDEFLREVWPMAKKALEFAFTYWDQDGDGVLESQQHNTYDIEFYGPNSLTNSIFYAALKAGAEIAYYLGDEASAERYIDLWRRGSEKMDQELWGGEYYVQQIENVDEHRYQFGKGCLTDQLLGQQLAHVNGLGYVLPEEHVRQTIKAIFDYNFCTEMRNHHNVQRTYALNGEKGLLLCSWPHGGRPRLPFVYSDEVWTGIEYQVASHLIYEGYVHEGLTIVEALRERFNGFNRSPFNEIECGNHYARSLASWGVLLALSGYHCDLVNRTLTFQPAINQDDFSCFFSAGTAWGVYHQGRNAQGEIVKAVEILGGQLPEGTVIG